MIFASLWLAFAMLLGQEASARLPQADVLDEAHIAELLRTLPEESFLRRLLEEGERGEGIRQPWMNEMRQEGVRVVLAHIVFVWDGGPKDFKIAWIKYLPDYGFDEDEYVFEKTQLEQVPVTASLQKRLQEAALSAAERQVAQDLRQMKMSRARGSVDVALVDDEWLPAPTAVDGHSLVDPDETELMRVAAKCGVYWESFVPPVPSEDTKPLVERAHRRAERKVAELLAAGAEVNARDQSGETALLWAAGKCSETLVRSLLLAGADVNAANRDGETPLMSAAARGSVEITRLLQAYGADVNARSEFGRSALSSAKEYGHQEVIGLLKEAGAKE